MMTPRQNRWLWACLCGRQSVLAVAAALLSLNLVVPGRAATASHGHTRRPLPTSALKVSSSAEGSTSGAGKHHTRAKAGPRSADAAVSPKSSRSSKARGKKRGAEPPADPVPMYRVKGNGRGAREQPLTRQQQRAALRDRTGRFASRPAPLVSSYRRGRYAAAAPAQLRPVASSRTWARTRPDPDAGRSYAARPIARPIATPPATAALPSRPSQPFAQGTAHPEDDERLPRVPTVADGGDSTDATMTAAPITRVSPAPTPSGRQGLTSTPLVQGFGGEVALPPANDSDRPGGTRRRNHPANWVPEAMNLSGEPLDEREAITEAAVSPAVLPLAYDRNGRLVMPAPLKGSHDILLHQNVMANSDGLERIQDDADLDRMRAAHLLVSFPLNETLRVNDDLPLNRRYARPWTVSFAADTARAFYAQFHQPLQVNSAVRTVSYQNRLQLVNGNAAASSGDAASPHLTGQAIDLAKRGMSQAQLAWMRDYLLPIMRAGKIDVEEEFQQACFHISVYRSYAPVVRRPVHEIAQRSTPAAAIGVALPSSPEEQ